MKDIVGLNDENGTVIVNVHTAIQCDGQPCVIHNPSQHHMLHWKPRWNDELGIMFRHCPHTLLHPDPDDVNYLRRINRLGKAIHPCDGCCQPTHTKEIGQ